MLQHWTADRPLWLPSRAHCIAFFNKFSSNDNSLTIKRSNRIQEILTKSFLSQLWSDSQKNSLRTHTKSIMGITAISCQVQAMEEATTSLIEEKYRDEVQVCG